MILTGRWGQLVSWAITTVADKPANTQRPLRRAAATVPSACLLMFSRTREQLFNFKSFKQVFKER
jgi:hypothetical protein